MLAKFKNLEPQTKAVINAVAVIAAINAVAVAAVVLMEKNEND